MEELSRQRKKELDILFNDEITSHLYDNKRDEYVDNWGGYSMMSSWPGSCGNKEWCEIGNDSLNELYTPQEVAYWMKLIRKVFIQKRLGSLFLSFPCDVKTGKPLHNFTKIASAVKLLRLKLLSRSINPHHRDHFQDTYILVKDNY